MWRVGASHRQSPFGHAAEPPIRMMNSRRFTAQYSRASTQGTAALRDVDPAYFASTRENYCPKRRRSHERQKFRKRSGAR